VYVILNCFGYIEEISTASYANVISDLKNNKETQYSERYPPSLFFRQPIDQVWHWCINDTW